MAQAKEHRARAFVFEVEPIGHWHVFCAKRLRFTVREPGAGGETGLNLVFQVAHAGLPENVHSIVASSDVQEEGDGVYAMDFRPFSLGAYAVIARFVYDHQEFVSEPAAFEVARDGEEGIRVDAGNSSYVYQIRYNWEPSQLYAHDTAEVKLVFEIMRGIQEGMDITWDQPWLNAFDHVTSAERTEVLIESKDTAVRDKVVPLYRGYGVYEARRAFPVAEVGVGRDYTVRFTFTDPHNGARVTQAEAYGLYVASPS